MKWNKMVRNLRIMTLCIILAFHQSSTFAPKRYKEKLFNSATVIAGRKVYCQNGLQQIPEAVHPAETWTCYHISIDNMRLLYETGFGRSFSDEDSNSNNRSKPSSAIDDFTGKNEATQICRLLLKAHGIHKDMWAAYALDSAFAPVQEPRIILMRNQTNLSEFEWKVVPSSHYHIGSLRCTVMN